MRKIFFITILVSPLYFYSQEEEITVNVKKQPTIAESIAAGAANRAARAAEAAAMADPSTDVKVPVTTDLNNYTHIAVVSVDVADIWTGKTNTKSVVKQFVPNLNSSPLTVVNPLDDKKAFKKNKQYLKNKKNPSWLYLYYSSKPSGVDTGRTLIIRNSSNKIIYSASHINTPINEVLFPIVGF